MHIINKITVLILLDIVTEISDVKLRLVTRKHIRMLIIRIKAKGILEVVQYELDVSLGSLRTNLIIGLRLLNALKVVAKELFWR